MFYRQRKKSEEDNMKDLFCDHLMIISQQYFKPFSLSILLANFGIKKIYEDSFWMINRY